VGDVTGSWVRLTYVAALALALAASAGASTSSKPSPPGWILRGPYAPTIDPATFVRTIDNPYFPLRPGSTFHFAGVSDGTPQTDDVVVTKLTKVVLGVRCTVVRDTVSENGKAVERTFDWYAQDRRGNVWYMGEDSLELRNGRLVRADDSWEVGVRGGKPGIIMQGHPHPGDVYRQEYYRPGGALDQARVTGTTTTVRVPGGSSRPALVTVEWSPVEPQLERKLYVRGLGEVEEEVIAGGHERFRLVRATS
jgi:hypothetical protein